MSNTSALCCPRALHSADCSCRAQSRQRRPLSWPGSGVAHRSPWRRAL